jgi:hypothetical protein
MNAFIDLSKLILSEMENSGWIIIKSYRTRNDPRILERNGSNIMVAGPIKIDSLTSIDSQINDYFTNICDSLDKLKKKGLNICEVLMQGGGTVPIPDYFKAFCDKNNIKIKLFNEENIESVVKGFI